MKFPTAIHTLGNKVLVRGIDTEKGHDYIRRDEFKPTMFVQGKQGQTKYRNLQGDPVYPIQPGSMKETRDFIKQYSDVDGFKIEGNDNFALQYVCEQHPKTIKWDPKAIRICNIDIEVESDKGFPHPDKAASIINAITIYDNLDDVYYTWALGSWNNHREDITVVYVECADEKVLLDAFIRFWQIKTPHVVTGWNIDGFDIPYIINRIARLYGVDETKKLSPFGFIRERKVRNSFGKESIVYNIYGVASLDYLELYKKFTYKTQESYRLDHIAHVELDERKLSYAEEGSLLVLSRINHQKFIDYNIKDVEIVKKLDDKLKLIDLALTMAYDAKINIEDVFGTVKPWDAIIYDYLLKDNIVAPARNTAFKTEKFEGAYVKTPITGFHDWVVSFDLNSLYPHLIMQYNISPETLVGHRDDVSVENLLNSKIDLSDMIDDNTTVAPNGSLYTREFRGFLPKLMEKIYNERKIFKRKMLDAQQDKENGIDVGNKIEKYDNIQMAKKIQLNSAYGAIGNQYFRYYDLRNAEAITTSGQLSIKWIEKKLNVFLNKICKTDDYDFVIAIDTDSVYLRLDKIVQGAFKNSKPTKEKIVDFLDTVCKKSIEPFIDNSYQDLANYVNAYEQKMFMGRESISDRGLWTAKKRYALNVYDNEGVRFSEPKMKVMGLEIVKSSTPAHVREKLREAVKLMLTGTELQLQDLVHKYKIEFYNLDPEDISFPRGISNYTKYQFVDKSVPIHVRGAKLFNKLLNDNDMKSVEPIGDGTKVKFSYLKVPNPFHQNVISFVTGLPPEFNMNEWIDYDVQFDKTFLKPIEGLLAPVGWEWEVKSSLNSFFK